MTIRDYIQKIPAGLILFLLLPVLVFFKYWIISDMQVPVAYGDEYRYLSKAINFAQTGLPSVWNISGPNYPPLYSVLLSPVYLFDYSPINAYRLVLLLNTIILWLAVIPLYLLTRRFGLGKIGQIALPLFLVFFPNYFYYSSTAQSENLIIPLYLWLLYFLFRFSEAVDEADTPGDNKTSGPLKYGLILGALTALCVLTRSFFVMLIPVYLVFFGIFILENRKRGARWLWKNYGGPLVIILLMTVTTLLVWKYIELNFVQPHDQVSPLNRYKNKDVSGYNLEKYITALGTLLREPLTFLKIAVNHISYVTSASFFGVLVVLGFGFFQLRRGGPDWARLDLLRRQSLLFFLLTLVFTAGIVFLHCFRGYQFNPDKYELYTRYFDPLIPLCFGYGIMVLRLNRPPRKFFLYFILPVGILLLLLAPDIKGGLSRVSWIFNHPLETHYDFPPRWQNLIILGLALVFFIGAFTGRLSKKVFFSWILIITFINDIQISRKVEDISRMMYDHSKMNIDLRKTERTLPLPVYAHVPSLKFSMWQNGYRDIFKGLWAAQFLTGEPLRYFGYRGSPHKLPRGKPFLLITNQKNRKIKPLRKFRRLGLYRIRDGQYQQMLRRKKKKYK